MACSQGNRHGQRRLIVGSGPCSAADRFVIVAEKSFLTGSDPAFDREAGGADITLSADRTRVIDVSVVVGDSVLMFDETQGFTDAAVSVTGDTFDVTGHALDLNPALSPEQIVTKPFEVVVTCP